MERYNLNPGYQSKPHFIHRNNISSPDPYREYRIEHLADDFYTNLLAWNTQTIAYGHEDKVYAINFFNSTSKFLSSFSEVSCLKFDPTGRSLAVGCFSGEMHIFDMQTAKSTSFKIHKSRIGVIEWSEFGIFTGSRDKQLKFLDPRSGLITNYALAHQQEICGLKVNSTNGLIATGGNDNLMNLHDIRVTRRPIATVTCHKAAVKAIAWSQNHAYSLLSGGGTADKSIKKWDVSNKLELVQDLQTDSQICNLHWTKSNLIIATTGYSQNNSRILSSTFNTLQSNPGHRNRIIHFAISPMSGFISRDQLIIS